MLRWESRFEQLAQHLEVAMFDTYLGTNSGLYRLTDGGLFLGHNRPSLARGIGANKCSFCCRQTL